MHWYVFVVLSLTAYRATRLLVRDTFPPVLWIRDRLAGGWRNPTRAEMWHESYPQGELEEGVTQAVPDLGMFSLVDGKIQRWVSPASWAPHWLAELITCPWCASAYISGALVLATDLAYGLPVPWLIGPSVWAVSAWLVSRDWA